MEPTAMLAWGLTATLVWAPMLATRTPMARTPAFLTPTPSPPPLLLRGRRPRRPPPPPPWSPLLPTLAFRTLTPWPPLLPPATLRSLPPPPSPLSASPTLLSPPWLVDTPVPAATLPTLPAWSTLPSGLLMPRLTPMPSTATPDTPGTRTPTVATPATLPPPALTSPAWPPPPPPLWSVVMLLPAGTVPALLESATSPKLPRQ